jgi:hypothetical protein
VSLHSFTLEEKLEEIEQLIVESRRPGSRYHHDRFLILKAIAADLRATLDKPRSLSLGELERCIRKVKESHSALGYEAGRLVETANTLIHHWPFVRQALEHFGEETVE